MIRLASVLLLLFLAGTQVAMAQVEIVIDVPEAEAQAILQSYAPDELRYADTSWDSNGRIRLAKINSEALKQSGVEIQFTPFADVDPIVMMSNGIEGHTWTGERVYNRIDGFDEHGQMAEAIKNHPEIKKMGVADQILARISNLNRVQLGINRHLIDADTGEHLLDPTSPDADTLVMNAKTGSLQSIHSLERKYKGYVERAGIDYPCEKPGAASNSRRDQAPGQAGKDASFSGFSTANDAQISPPIVPGVILIHGHSQLQLPCNPAGHVLDRIAALPENARKHSMAHNYRRASPLPADVRHVETAGGSIVDKSNEPFSKATGHVYTVTPLIRHPEYVVIHERDRSRDHMLFEPPNDPDAYYATEGGAKIKRLREEKAEHRRQAQARIDARNKSRGDK